MIPGKKYKPEDFLEIAWRRKWVILLLLIVCAVGTFGWSQTLPNRYRSEAVVLIIPPQVPETIIRTTITESLQERLDLMQQQILSRTRLERIIQEFDLYAEDRKRLLMEQVVEQMRADIGVTVPKVGRKQDPGYFVVSFDSEKPQTAMVVTERLASLFVRENLEGRGLQADATSQFLQSQVDEALRKLQEHEQRLEAFRRSNAGRLPEEVETNLQMMQSARQELQAQTDGINRDRDRQITIERLIADEMALGPVAASRPPAGAAAAVLPAAQELQAANAALDRLQLRLKQDHPDVRMAKSRIAELEKRVASEALQQPVSEGGPAGPLSVTDADRLRRVGALRTEFESLGRAIETKRARAEAAEATIAKYQQLVQAAPMLESQLSGLMRDYSTLQSTYETLLRKMQEARVSANLEQRQVGEQFRIIDPARLPETPRHPDRLRINLIGAFLGLGLGLAIAGLLEYRDTSLRSEEDVLVALSLPVVALIPALWTGAEIKKARRRRRVLLGASLGITLAASAAALFWKFRLLESWGL